MQVPAEEIRQKIFTTHLTNDRGEVIALRLFDAVDAIMEYSNDYNKVLGIVARLLRARGVDRNQIEVASDVHYLPWDERLLFIVNSRGVDPVVKSKTTLVGLAPVWIRGCWCTRGRLSKGLFKVLGVDWLHILLPDNCLAYLVVTKPHNEVHKGPITTLWRSRSKAWVWRGRKLAVQVE